MKTVKKLLGFRYSKDFFLNRRRINRLNPNQSTIETSSHDCCPMCGCTTGVLISEVDRVGFPCDTVICDGCQFVFNDTYIVNPALFYSQQWGIERWGEPEKSFIKRTASDSYSWKRMAYVAKRLGEKFQALHTVLEVGCGDGCNLLPYHLIGKEVTGCDFDPRYLEPGRKRGMNLVEGDVFDLPAQQQFDLVMLIHSFEHMMDLDACVQETYRHMAIGGVVYVEVPGILNMNRTRAQTKQAMGLTSGPNVLGYLQFQHNYHFDLDHIVHVWERNGFELIEGDEWVRTIFRKVEEPKDRGGSLLQRRANQVYDHLIAVERDLYTPKTLVSGLMKRYLK